MEIDLDQLRAVRLEHDGSEPKFFLFGGEKFALPPELPWDFALALSDGEVRGGFRTLMGDEDYERFMALRPSAQDMTELIKGLDGLYVGSPGEASAVSGPSSGDTSGA